MTSASCCPSRWQPATPAGTQAVGLEGLNRSGSLFLGIVEPPAHIRFYNTIIHSSHNTLCYDRYATHPPDSSHGAMEHAYPNLAGTSSPAPTSLSGAHSRRALVSCECPSRLLLPVQLLRGTLHDSLVRLREVWSIQG